MNRAERKKQLIAQGAFYRTEVILAKQAVQHGLQPQSLARSALQKIAPAALAMFASRKGAGKPGAPATARQPVMTAAVSALSKRKPLIKTALRGALVAGAAAGVAALLLKKRAHKTANNAAHNAAHDASDNAN